MLYHLAIALLIQVAVIRLLRASWSAGAVAAACWVISREITQAEYRWIATYGEGLRANMPWWGALDPKVWHADAMIDWLLPTTAVVALAFRMNGRSQNKTKGRE